MKTYCINMDESSDRYARFTSQIARYPFLFNRYERFQAIKGAQSHRSLDVRFQDYMTPSQIGCALSHFTIWEKVHGSDDLSPEDWVMITEDDVVFVDDVDHLLSSIVPKIPTFIPFCYVGCFGQCDPDGKIHNYVDLGLEITTKLLRKKKLRPKTYVKVDHRVQLFQPSIPVGFHCYLIRKELCSQLVTNLTIRTHIDFDFFLFATTHQIPISAIWPMLAYQPTTTQTSTMTSQSFPRLLNHLLDQVYDERSLMSNSYFMSVPMCVIKGVPINFYIVIAALLIVTLKRKGIIIVTSYVAIDVVVSMLKH